VSEQTPTVTKRVRFYRIYAVDDEGKQVRLGSIDWAKIIRQYSGRPAGSRRLSINQRDHQVNTSGISDYHLIAIKLRQAGDTMPQVDDETGEVVEIPVSGGGKTIGDASSISFLRGSGVFGYVAASGASPRPSIVSHWLNDLQPISGMELQFVAVPLVASADLGKLKDAWGAKKLAVQVPVSAFQQPSTALGQELWELAQAAGEGTLRIELSTGRRTPSKRYADALRDLAEALPAALGDGASAQATVMHEVPSRAKKPKAKDKTRLESELVDLIATELADSFPLSLAGSEETMLNATLTAIDRSMAEMQGRLRRAWEAASGGSGEDS
jgi:hypothetical protein